MKRADALRLSEDMGLDLLVVASKANPPVCKILDYGKFHFEKQKKERQQIRTQKIAQRDAKEIRFKINISDHDGISSFHYTHLLAVWINDHH